MKRLLAKGLCWLQVDSLFRHINRRKFLAVMYHGVTRNQAGPNPWTQLPAAVFEGQVEFLSQSYNLLSLSDLIESIRSKCELPERSALITFDDGLRNNLTVAFPILERFRAPAAIFLATDYIGSKRLFWFDELYLILLERRVREGVAVEMAKGFDIELHDLSESEVYFKLVEYLKSEPERVVESVMAVLRSESSCDFNQYAEDYSVLDWSEIRWLDRTGLVEFGVHTAEHRILSHLPRELWESEIRVPRRVLSQALGRDVVAFAYPNGRPKLDYSEIHKSYLRESGYVCAFNTNPSLAVQNPKSVFDLSRIPAGNDQTSDLHFFRLMSSGVPGLFPSS